LRKYLFLLLSCTIHQLLFGQAITGFWKGKTGKGLFPQKVEVKLILRGDSIAGTSYYYESKNRYVRYSVKGYFNVMDNTVVWWDDQLIADKSYRAQPMHSEADFNCPGEGVMKLDGKAQPANGEGTMETHLQKTEAPVFEDEWDELIANYTIGSNNPYIIDSVKAIALNKKMVKEEVPVIAPVINTPAKPVKNAEKKSVPTIVKEDRPAIDEAKPLTSLEKFSTRKKEFTTEIAVLADSIEINFYDNAEIDGDTISIYLDNRLIYQNVGLSDRAFTIKLARNQLQPISELVMVAENLGSIPPNTSLMVAYVKEQRYEARLQSTENSSAMIRLLK
jgi:hypothetical protein